MSESNDHTKSGTDIYKFLAYAVIFLFFAVQVWSADIPWVSTSQYGHSSAHVLTSGKHFAQDGFIACKLLPIFQPGKIYPGYEEYYTHYPPLSDLLNGVMRRLGFDSMRAFRLPFILAGVLAGLFWFLFLKEFFNSKAAFFCLLFLLVLPEHLAGLDCLFSHAFDQLFRFSAMFATYLLWSGQNNDKKKTLVFLWLIMFFQSLMTYEYIMYLQLFAWGYVLLFKNFREEKKKLFILLTAPVIGVFLHVLQNIWALGISGMIADLTGAYQMRTTHGMAYLPKMARAVKLFFWNIMPMFSLKSDNAIIAFVFWSVLIISLYELFKNKEIKKFWRLLFLLFACDISWYILFPQHVLVHIQPIKSTLASVTLLTGIIFYVNIEKLKKELHSNDPFGQLKSLTVFAVFFLLYSFNLSRLNISIQNKRTVSPVEYRYRDLKCLLPEDAVCFTNVGDDWCRITYYLDRRTYYQKTLPGFKRVLGSIMKAPFFNKDKIYYISHGYPKPALKDYLDNNAERVYKQGQAIIYKVTDFEF